MKKLMILSAAATLLLNTFAGEREFSDAIKDAAEKTVASIAGDSRASSVKSIAFVRLNAPDSKGVLPLGSNVSQIFETTLLAKPERFTFVTHSSHVEEWKLIDEIFDQAEDFESYDPKTHPELNKLKLADALLIGQIIDAKEDERKNETEYSVRVVMRLIKVSTGEQIWGQVIDGRHLVKIDRINEMKEEAKSYLTLSNMLKLAGYVAGGIIGLILLIILLRQMIRVR
ncbi:MAG: hypothetical protein IKL02_10360 [Kiritimatiellae bacterium]|nr:hypothetical protein [Kiritimatiellia bacterium]